MKRFTFPLEALLEKRKREEDAIKRELGEKNREITRSQDLLNGLEQALRQLQEDQKKSRSTVTDVLMLRSAVSYRDILKRKMVRKGQDIYELQCRRAEIRQRLVRATQRKKAIELVRESRYQEWMKEYKLKEQVFIDDVSQQGFIRKKRIAQNTSVA